MEIDNEQSWKDSFFELKADVKNLLTGKEFQDTTGILGEIQNIAKIFFYLLTPVGVGLLLIIKLFQEIPAKVELVVVGLNILILFLWFAFMRRRKLKYHELKFQNEESKEEYCKFLGIKYKNCDKEAEDKNKRVNVLVSQLKSCIVGYVVCLLVVYLAFLFGNECLWHWAQCEDSYNNKMSPAKWYYFLKVLQDIFNLISAAFLYVGFKVLYNLTLNKKNKPNFYFLSAIVVCIVVIAPYLHHIYFKVPYPAETSVVPQKVLDNLSKAADEYSKNIVSLTPPIVEDIKNLSNSTPPSVELMNRIKQVTDKYNSDVHQNGIARIEAVIDEYEGAKIQENKKLSNIFALIIGSLNGLAMALLFGRCISMQHLTDNQKEKIVYNRFSIWVVFLLPIYALAQPLFGIFEINAFGNPKVFANCIFFICLLGKMFFLYFIYKFIKERKLHYYLHFVITSHDVINDFKNFFEDKIPETKKVEDKTNENEIKNKNI
jgi:hypothetical protein